MSSGRQKKNAARRVRCKGAESSSSAVEENPSSPEYARSEIGAQGASAGNESVQQETSCAVKHCRSAVAQKLKEEIAKLTRQAQAAGSDGEESKIFAGMEKKAKSFSRNEFNSKNHFEISLVCRPHQQAQQFACKDHEIRIQKLKGKETQNLGCFRGAGSRVPKSGPQRDGWRSFLC